MTGEVRCQSKHVPILDHLRGLAAIAVAFFHFSNGNVGFLPETDFVKQLGSTGWLGVESFFVISGFVIPYSLHLKAYRIADFWSFMARRLKRLEPPYLACIALVILLNVISALTPGFQGAPMELGWQEVLFHFAYLNAIFDYEWLNPIFWTLAIEFQFYIFIALIFQFIAHSNPVVRAGSILIVLLAGFLGAGNDALLPHWLPLFAIGIVTFQLRVKLLSITGYVLLLFPLILGCSLVVGPLQSAVGLSTAMVIAIFGSRQLPKLFMPLAFFGAISYSLYLIHVPIGGRVINLGTRLPESVLYLYPTIVIAIAASTVFAYFFWKYIERPSQRWSKG